MNSLDMSTKNALMEYYKPFPFKGPAKLLSESDSKERKQNIKMAKLKIITGIALMAIVISSAVALWPVFLPGSLLLVLMLGPPATAIVPLGIEEYYHLKKYPNLTSESAYWLAVEKRERAAEFVMAKIKYEELYH